MVLPAIPVVAWVLGALGLTSIVGAAMGWIVPAILALVLLGIGYITLTNGIRSMAVADNMIFPIILIIVAFGSFAMAIHTIDPSFFGKYTQFSFGGGTGVASMETVQMFSQVSIESSVIGQLDSIGVWLMVIISVIGVYSFVELIKNGS